MKTIVALVLALLASRPAVANDALTLAADGKSDYVITLPSQPIAPQTTAARELQEHLAKVIDVELKILSEGKVAADAPQIVIGPSERMKQLLPGVDVNTLGYDGIVIKTVGRNLVLAGRPPRGTLYAVYTFLEDIVGCRWWTSTERFVPKKPTLTIPALDITYAPKLLYREVYYRDALAGVFAARSKCNGASDGCGPEYGGVYHFAGPGVHTFYHLLPPKKYFAAHPEWYSEIGGKREREYAQLCLTNAQMRKELTKNALEWLRESPDASLISISQNDGYAPCECAKCKAVEAEEGSPSGPVLRFVNAVAEDIEKEFPNVLVETLAYVYSRKPPQHVRPRRNVLVRMCSIECCFSQPLDSGPLNEDFRRDIDGWSKIAPRLFIWDYVTNFRNYLLPHPNHRVLVPNIRFFANHHAIGLFEQGDVGCSIGDFVRLRAWLLAHMMWNPEADETALIRDFMQGYYGAAAPHLTAYLALIDDAVARWGKPFGCYQSTAGWLTLDDLNKATGLFDQAQAAVAGEPVLAERVQRERLPLDYAWLSRYRGLRSNPALAHSTFLGPKDPAAACEEFIGLAEKFKVGEYREGSPFAEHAEALRRRFRPSVPPKLCANLPADAWVDLQDSELVQNNPGKWAMTVDDPKASDGKAVRMPGDHQEWGAYHCLSDDYALGGPWHCYAVARCEAKVKDGPAMEMGIYDADARKDLVRRRVDVGESVGSEYRVFDLGTHDLKSEMMFWFAPTKRPGQIDAVYVDRVFLIREKKPGPQVPLAGKPRPALSKAATLAL